MQQSLFMLNKGAVSFEFDWRNYCCKIAYNYLVVDAYILYRQVRLRYALDLLLV